MATVEELVIKATPEGIGDTVDGLEQIENQTEASTESIEEQANSMSDLTNKFAGAMAAISAGFAVVSGTLLSRVPVLGEAAAGFGAVLSALGLKIDQTLRPALVPFTDSLFRLARAINNAEGPVGTLIGVGATLSAILAGLAATVFAVGTAWTFLGGILSSIAGTISGVLSGAIVGLLAKFGLLLIKGGALIAGVIKPLAVAIGGVISGISALTVGIALLIAAVVGFIAAYVTNWKGARTKTNRILNSIKNIVLNAFSTFISKSLEFLTTFVANATTRLEGMRSDIVKIFSGLISKAIQFGRDLANNFAEGIRDGINNAIGAAEDLASRVRDRLPGSPAETGPLSDLDETGTGLVDTFSAGVSDGLGRVGGGLVDGDPNTGGNASAAIARSNDKTIIEIEGRQVERATRDFRSDGTDLRGRYG
jgi:phage-related protein